MRNWKEIGAWGLGNSTLGVVVGVVADSSSAEIVAAGVVMLVIGAFCGWGATRALEEEDLPLEVDPWPPEEVIVEGKYEIPGR